MLRMAVGHSDDIDLEAAPAAVFGQLDDGLRGAVPKGGLVFAAWDIDHATLLERIVERYPGVQLAGSTTTGEMSSVLGFQEDSIAVALFASDDVDISVGVSADFGVDPGS